MFGSITFRRILLSRILLLSVPVLLIGQFVTYRQVRLSLLAATHDRLMQSADRKGEHLANFVAVLRSSASIAREASSVTAGDAEASQIFLERLDAEGPESVRCIWLEATDTDRVLASSCGERPSDVPAYAPVAERQGDARASGTTVADIATRTFFSEALAEEAHEMSEAAAEDFAAPAQPDVGESDLGEPASVELDVAEPEVAEPNVAADASASSGTSDRETFLLLDAPIRSATAPEDAPYVLRMVSRLPEEYRSHADAHQHLLSNATLIVDATGTILAYPLPGYIGRNLGDLSGHDRLVAMEMESSVEFAQRTTFAQNMFQLDGRSRWAIVGYTEVLDPTQAIAFGDDGQWVVMAVADLDLALQNLASVRSVMLNLVLLLLAANLSATLFLARDLALPVERLGRYARSIECNTTPEALPSSFAIEEFNQLAAVMNASIERLKSWATELSEAWQQARQSNQLKSEFLTTISHELRTPLNGIIGSLRLIRDGFCESRSEELEFLQRADDSAIHLLEIIDDILDISNIEAGTVTLLPESIDLREIVRDALDVQQHDLEAKELTLDLDLGEKHTMVYVDSSKLRRVLVSVIGNAIKFTDIGTIGIRIRVQPGTLHASFEEKASENPVPCAAIEVTDTGIGIDPRIRDRLFEPFVMSDGSTTRKFGGTGLGLAISRNLLEMMHGRIGIDSLGVDRGTTVTIEVPLAHAETRSLAKTAPTPASQGSKGETDADAS